MVRTVTVRFVLVCVGRAFFAVEGGFGIRVVVSMLRYFLISRVEQYRVTVMKSALLTSRNSSIRPVVLVMVRRYELSNSPTAPVYFHCWNIVVATSCKLIADFWCRNIAPHSVRTTIVLVALCNSRFSLPEVVRRNTRLSSAV